MKPGGSTQNGIEPFFDGTHTELEEMLRLADETMYEVKRAGKGNVLVRSF